MADDKASGEPRREQQPEEGGREISAGGAASYMNPDEGEEDVANPVARLDERLGAAAGAAVGALRGASTDAARKSGSAGDAGEGGIIADPSSLAGAAAAGTVADAESQLREAGSQVGAALKRGAGAAAGLVASAVGQGSAEGATEERLGSSLPARGDDRVVAGTDAEVVPATGASQLGADRRELLPVDAVGATGSSQAAAVRDGVADAGVAGLDDRESRDNDVDRRRDGGGTAAQVAAAGSQAARGSVGGTDPVAGVQPALGAGWHAVLATGFACLRASAGPRWWLRLCADATSQASRRCEIPVFELSFRLWAYPVRRHCGNAARPAAGLRSHRREGCDGRRSRHSGRPRREHGAGRGREGLGGSQRRGDRRQQRPGS